MNLLEGNFSARLGVALLCVVLAVAAVLPSVSIGQEIDVETIVIDPLRSPDCIGQGYWEEVARALAQIENVKLACYEEEHDRLLLVGDAARTTEGLRMDALALALENVHAHEQYKAEPLGMTIDPDTIDFYGPEMIVRYFGGSEHTRSGRIMFECDRLLKCLSTGKDNITGQPASSSVPGFKNLLQLGMEMGGRDTEPVFDRFWYVLYATEISDRNPRYRSVLLKLEGERGVYFEQVPVFVRTEIMYRAGNELVSSFGKIDPKAEAFAEHFNEHYDAYAAEMVELRQIKQLGNLMSLALWLEEERVPFDRLGLAMYRSEFTEGTPSRTPSVRNSLSETSVDTTWGEDSYTIHTETRTSEVFGGVEFEPKNFYRNDADGVGAALLRAAREVERKPAGKVLSWTFEEGGTEFAAVALPDPDARIKPGSYQKRTDAVMNVEGGEPLAIGLHRFHSPYGYRNGDFGPRFAFGIPRLIALPTNQTTWIQGKRKKTTVAVSECALRDELGTIHIQFSEPAIDQERGEIYYPTDHPGVIGYYPGENLIRLADGTIALDPVYNHAEAISDNEGNAVLYEYGLYQGNTHLQSIISHRPPSPPAVLSVDRNRGTNVVERVFGSNNDMILRTEELVGGGESIELKTGEKFKIDGNGDVTAIEVSTVELSLDYERYTEGNVSSRRLSELGLTRRGRAPPRYLFRPVYGEQGLVGELLVNGEESVAPRRQQEDIGEFAVFAYEDCAFEFFENGELYRCTVGEEVTFDFKYVVEGDEDNTVRMDQHMVIVEEAGEEPRAALVLRSEEGACNLDAASQVAAYRYGGHGALVEFRNMVTNTTEAYTYQGPTVEVRTQ